MVCVILLVALVLPVGANQEMPRINVDGVVPNQPGNLRSLKPGIEVSIYGQHLGPTIGCTAGAGAGATSSSCAEPQSRSAEFRQLCCTCRINRSTFAFRSMCLLKGWFIRGHSG